MHRVARRDSAGSRKTTCQFTTGLMNRRHSWLTSVTAPFVTTRKGFSCAKIFGVTITNSEGKQIPVRYIGEQHVKEDLGRIPTAQDWLSQIQPQRWMYGRPLAADDS